MIIIFILQLFEPFLQFKAAHRSMCVDFPKMGSDIQTTLDLALKSDGKFNRFVFPIQQSSASFCLCFIS